MKLSVITPCYNNEGSLEELMNRLQQVVTHPALRGMEVEYVFVDDGSTDQTWQELRKLKSRYPEQVRLIKLARNFGSYNSFLAGMNYARGDVNVYVHADLQDPPELIPEMIAHYRNGYRLVIAHRAAREDGSVFSALYHLMMRYFGIRNIPAGGFDLILFDKTIREHIVAISEKNTNNVYLITWLGFPYVSIPYRRAARRHGKSMWSFRKKARLFVDSMFSFTTIPLWIFRCCMMAALLFFLATIVLNLIGIEKYPFQLSYAVFWGVPIVLLWMIAEYLDRIHESVRQRPNFVVDIIE